ncbi:hypothetical protein AAV94_12670 [Lampropedia cohaerens]|uniref:Phage gp6-like head-tail connector protein n=1 Tax=Lampropedia cohaerens TaxID=1610491 RepID=A0A0U1PWU4_9BURK|nr:head-tail connector protein [Lampropedia cohaerens]KKW66926.1 hypothetical protein AAV94_12670 [Lampropedia cohaerens]
MIDLEALKSHLRIDHDAEDTLLQKYLDASKAAVLDYLDVPELPDAAPVDAAVLLGAGDLYLNREGQASGPLTRNSTYDRLLYPYRRHA